MRLARVSWWASLLIAMACGGKSSTHGATSSAGAGAGGETVKVPASKGGMAAKPAVGGESSSEPGPATAGAPGAAGDAAGGGEGGAPPAAVLRFCDQNSHQFCADFDGPTFDDGWDETGIQGSGSLEPSTVDSTSAPHSLLSKIENPGVELSSATLNLTFPAGAERYELAFDLFIDQTIFDDDYPMPELKLFEVVNGDSSTGLSLAFDGQGDRLWYRNQTSNSGLVWGGFVPVNEWIRVVLSCTYGTFGTGVFELKLGRATPIPWSDTSLGQAPGAIQLRLGLQTTNPTSPAVALYDNVTFDLEP